MVRVSFPKPRKPPSDISVAIFQNQLHHHLSQRRPMLESVSRSSAEQPDVLHSRMAIHNKVAVGSLLVLTDAGFDQRSIFHRRKTESNIFANALQRCRANHALAVSRIERPATRVV